MKMISDVIGSEEWGTYYREELFRGCLLLENDLKRGAGWEEERHCGREELSFGDDWGNDGNSEFGIGSAEKLNSTIFS